ncbi:MAG: TetR/AcrR family transcriptional regulator [Fusobacteriaceae bacterium]|nr:TetR/AcrR family transcriptional regulator [Fusobacteriaceae bacterium]
MQVLKDEIRNKILVVAEDLFFENGFKDTTMRGIADKVQISVSNLYLYYKNKENIFYAVTENFYSSFFKGFLSFISKKENHGESENHLPDIFIGIIKKDYKKFVIIMDKSQNTKYEGLKEEISKALSKHIYFQIGNDNFENSLILYILSKNFFEGIIEIAKNYKENSSLEKDINALISYHLGGVQKLTNLI